MGKLNFIGKGLFGNAKTEKLCDHRNVLHSSMIYYLPDDAIEIQIIAEDRAIDVGVYHATHNEEGNHDESRWSIPINYCPLCGKKL